MTPQRLIALAMLILTVLWFFYGLLGAAAFSSEVTSVSWWFDWQVPAVLTVAVSVAFGTVLPSSRGIVASAVLAAIVVASLLLGILVSGAELSEPDERSFGVFAVGTVALLALGWIGGQLVHTLWQRFRRGPPTATAVVVVSIIIGTVLVVIPSRLLAPDPDHRTTTASLASTQPTARGNISIERVIWDAPHHAYMPRLGQQTVALEVRYRPIVSLPMSRLDWTASGVDRGMHEAIVWPNRRPLRNVGEPLRSGELTTTAHDASGWIAFVVPRNSRWLDVSLDSGQGDVAIWRVDADGVVADTSG